MNCKFHLQKNKNQNRNTISLFTLYCYWKIQIFSVCSTQRTKFLRLFALNFATKLKFIHFEIRLECVSECNTDVCLLSGFLFWESARSLARSLIAHIVLNGIGKSPLRKVYTTQNTHSHSCEWERASEQRRWRQRVYAPAVHIYIHG